ncbi:MAG: hypothetical protein JWO87_874 [Phycisphaerales bacterium]|nr:hypothetical protein [Phycisphaerales bacterium]
MKPLPTKLIAKCAMAALGLGGIVAIVKAVETPQAAAPTTRPAGPATRPVWTVSRAAAPATQPAPAAATVIPAPKPLSDPYKIVVIRPIFSRERPRPAWITNSNGGGSSRGGPDTRPGTGGFASSSSEASVALKGVSLEDGVYTAFIEDSVTRETRGLHAGEAVARGMITAMSLDGIDYATGGRVLRISIGQTLDGATPPAPAYPSAVASSSKPAWPAATSGDTGDRGPRDFRSRDGGPTDSPRDFRSRDAKPADAPRDSGSANDQRGPSADRAGGQSDQKSAATEKKSPAPQDQQDSGIDPGGFGPP